MFIEVTLERTKNEVLKGLARTVKNYSELIECHMIADDFDFLLKLRFKVIQEYRNI